MYYLRLAHMIQNNTFLRAKSIDERFILDGQTYKLISIKKMKKKPPLELAREKVNTSFIKI